MQNLAVLQFPRYSKSNTTRNFAYDAWGRLLTTTGSMSGTLGLHNPLRYRGYVYDQETGLYYLQSRYYNPQFCRFLSADTFVSTGQGILGYNMFAYCNNNPVKYVDHLGYFGLCVLNDSRNVYRAFMTPGMFGGGGGGNVPGISSSYYALQNVRAYDRYWRNSGYNMPSSGWTSGVKQSLSSESKTDFYVTPNGEVIPATIDDFKSNLSKLENLNGKFIGSDSYGPIRIRFYEIHEADPYFIGIPSPYHTIPHFHIDRRVNGETGRWVPIYTGAMEMLR